MNAAHALTAVGTLAPHTTGPAFQPNAIKSAQADGQKLMKAVRDFEAMAIGQLLQPIFDTANLSRNLFGGGEGEEAWRPMMVQELAKQMEAAGGLGLAAPIYAAMLEMQERSGRSAPAGEVKQQHER
jgi:peptidoglycan hydrolase FlgJ